MQSIPLARREPADGDSAFISRLTALRDRAREQISEVGLSPSYPDAAAAIVDVLATALATELACVLRYKRHHFATHGIHAKFVASEFFEHANEEQVHADQIAERIVQLGGVPDLTSTTLTRPDAEYDESTSLRAMLEADLVAEHIAIESYREMVTFIGSKDPTSRRLLESILAQEEEHAEDLMDLLEDVPRD